MIEIGPRHDKRASGFRHFLTIDSQESMCVNVGWFSKPRSMQHRRPEQGVKVENVLADEIVEFGIFTILPIGIEVKILSITQIFEAGHISDGSVQPDIKIFVLFFWNFEAEIRSIS